MVVTSPGRLAMNQQPAGFRWNRGTAISWNPVILSNPAPSAVLVVVDLLEGMRERQLSGIAVRPGFDLVLLDRLGEFGVSEGDCDENEPTITFVVPVALRLVSEGDVVTAVLVGFRVLGRCWCRGYGWPRRASPPARGLIRFSRRPRGGEYGSRPPSIEGRAALLVLLDREATESAHVDVRLGRFSATHAKTPH
jgi:hypothetical protein